MTTTEATPAKKKPRHLRAAVCLLLASAALVSFPFLQQSMQGSISSGNLVRIDASQLQMDSVTVFDGGGGGYVPAPRTGGSATTFRDMSNNVIQASGGFRVNPFSLNWGAGAPIDTAKIAADYAPSPYYQDIGRDSHPQFGENAPLKTASDPVSTFSIDVDTASYSFLRRMINNGQPVAKDAVRIEELINYFPYAYDVPTDVKDPFKPTVAVYDCPWNAAHKLMHIGIKGYALPYRPKSNLVFLIDTSGSMDAPDKLPLLINSFKLLLDTLRDDDTVSIVTYAGSAGVALEPTKASDKTKIRRALESLYAGGSTAGAEGIKTAYDLARQSFMKEGNNRVILATDGDFNVGISDADDLKDFITEQKDDGIFLSVLGFGEGNYQDTVMQALAQNGNGNAAYIDSLSEARKVLAEEVSSTLFTIAKDVKIQVEFNPALVREYRLIGYETRHLEREDFNNDKVDAGEVGAGHAVTAIYEITPVGAPEAVDDLRYKSAPAEKPAEAAGSDFQGELAFLKLRYKRPDAFTSTLMTRPITAADEQPFAALPDDLRFAASVAAFGQLMRGSKYAGSISWDKVIDIAQKARGEDAFGYRAEFINLAKLARSQGGKGE